MTILPSPPPIIFPPPIPKHSNLSPFLYSKTHGSHGREDAHYMTLLHPLPTPLLPPLLHHFSICSSSPSCVAAKDWIFFFFFAWLCGGVLQTMNTKTWVFFCLCNVTGVGWRRVTRTTGRWALLPVFVVIHCFLLLSFLLVKGWELSSWLGMYTNGINWFLFWEVDWLCWVSGCCEWFGDSFFFVIFGLWASSLFGGKAFFWQYWVSFNEDKGMGVAVFFFCKFLIEALQMDWAGLFLWVWGGYVGKSGAWYCKVCGMA